LYLVCQLKTGMIGAAMSDALTHETKPTHQSDPSRGQAATKGTRIRALEKEEGSPSPRSTILVSEKLADIATLEGGGGGGPPPQSPSVGWRWMCARLIKIDKGII